MNTKTLYSVAFVACFALTLLCGFIGATIPAWTLGFALFTVASQLIGVAGMCFTLSTITRGDY